MAGFDSLAQAAGRCNREGRLSGLGQVFVFHAPTEPPPGVLCDGRSVALSLLAKGSVATSWDLTPNASIFNASITKFAQPRMQKPSKQHAEPSNTKPSPSASE